MPAAPAISTAAQEFDPYTEFQAELEEIQKYKWVVSEQEGRDIGFERALTEWSQKYRAAFRRDRRRQAGAATKG